MSLLMFRNLNFVFLLFLKKRIGKNNQQILIDTASTFTGIYFPPEIMEAHFRKPQPITVVPTPLTPHLDSISSTSLTPRMTKITCNFNIMSQSKTVANLNSVQKSAAHVTSSCQQQVMQTRKSQPSMGIEVKAMKSRKLTLSQSSDSSYDSVDSAKSTKSVSPDT